MTNRTPIFVASTVTELAGLALDASAPRPLTQLERDMLVEEMFPTDPHADSFVFVGQHYVSRDDADRWSDR